MLFKLGDEGKSIENREKQEKNAFPAKRWRKKRNNRKKMKMYTGGMTKS